MIRCRATASKVSAVVVVFIIASCSVGVGTADLTPDPSPTFDLARIWYTNPDDDRYYYDFRPDGSLHHRYYQDYGSIGGDLNGFVTAVGSWEYLNEERSRFTVGWDDSVDRHYVIADNNATGIVVETDPDGPVGRGLGSTTALLRSARTVTYSVPDEITKLIATWYYEPSGDGQYLAFQGDGTCLYRYYQDYGGNLSGWVTREGDWSFDTTTGILTITMSGEVSYHYSIDELTSTTLVLSLSEDNPGSDSSIYTDGQFYR